MNAVHDAQNDTVRSPFYAAALKTKMRNLKAQDRRLEKEGYAHVDSVEEAIDVFFQCEGFPKSRRILEFHLEELKTDVSTLLQDIHITLYGRQKTVIAGENGCGKSLLMKEIHKVLKSHTDIRLGYMPQNYAEAFSAKDTPVTFLLEACDRDDITRARELLGRMKFTREEMEHSVYQLSEGQKAKLYLLRFIKQGCNVLLLDEPTNNLDLDAIAWLEEFLINFENTVIVVSHDRYFLNKVCTHIADIDYAKIQLYAGNYDFWYESSQLLIRQMKEANKKKEEKIKELQDFISRFSANASKSKQATSRKRALEKIELDEIKPSSRKYPYIDFRPNRDIGNEVLTVEGLSKTIDGVKILDNLTFTLNHDDKVAFVGGNELAKTVLFKILIGEMEPDEGTYKWGITTSQAYFPKDFGGEFDNDYTITEWLTQYSENKDATYVRGFLGRMLFSGEDGVKRLKVLSGGEKVRCLLSKMMISGANVLLLDEPTNHLDMESITALNNGMIKFPGVLLFTSRDHQIVQTTANRIMEIVPGGKLIDKITTYDEYLESDEMARKRQTYSMDNSEEDN